MDERLLPAVKLMMQRRGYEIPDNKNDLRDELRKLGKNSPRIMESFISTKVDKRMIIYFADNGTSNSISKEETKILGLLMIRLEIFNAILISEIPLSPKAKQEIEGLKIITFLDEDLLYDPTDSVFSSELISIGGREYIPEKNVHDSQLARLETEDIIAKYYGIEAGMIVTYKRQNIISETLVNEEIFPRFTSTRPLDKGKTIKK